MTQKHPEFSIVLHAHGAAAELQRTIESILSQDLGFEDHGELIIVQSEPSAALEELGSRFSSKSPEAVRQIIRPGLSQVEVWNAGLAESRGALLTFMDCRDVLDARVLGRVQSLSHDVAASSSLIAVPTARELLWGPKYANFSRLPETDSVIAVSSEVEGMPLYLTGLFIRRELALEHFPAAIDDLFAETRLVLSMLQAEAFRFGFAGKAGLRIEDPLQRDKLEPERALSRAEALLAHFEVVSSGGETSYALRSAMILLLAQMIKQMKPDWFDGPEQMRAFQLRFRRLLERLPVQELARSAWLRRIDRRYALDSAGGLDEPWTVGPERMVENRGESAFSVGEMPVKIVRINPRPNEVEFEVLFFDYQAGDLDLIMVSETGETLRPCEASVGDMGPGPYNSKRPDSRTHYRRFEVPTSPSRQGWRFAYVSSNFEGSVPVTGVVHHPKEAFSQAGEERRVFASGYRLEWSEERGFIVLKGYSSAFLYKIRRVWQYARQFRRFPWSVLLWSKRRRLIVINDRVEYGNDSGEALFRYIQEHRPELKRRTWFVLSKTAQSYPELASTRRIVQPYTFWHRIVYLNSRLHLSSHASPAYNSPWYGSAQSDLSDLFDPTFVWIRHGVTMNNVDHVYNRFHTNLDALVVTAGFEERYMKRPGSFFTDDTVIASCLPRFDRLHDRSIEQPRKSLLYMPTWRRWLTGPIQPGGSRGTVEGFEESEYFTQHRKLMTDPEILAALEEANAHFEFLIHPVMASYQPLYMDLASSNVVIREASSTSYADLFARGAGMITDYSSVFVDFSYMGKPVIFDQTDEEQFRGGHYTEGLFSYEKQGPGPVVRGYDDLKAATLELIRSDFSVAPRYQNRLDDFFLHRDHDNSKRVIDQAISLDERRRGVPFL